MTRFSILIPVYNRLPVTKQGLASLHNALERHRLSGQTTCTFQVVVIDDGSTDGSSDWIAKNYPSVHLVQGTGDLWWSGSINRGARYAVEQLHSDYLLLWNDDITPADDYFLEVERIFRQYPLHNTIIGSKIVYKEKKDRVWSVGGYFNKTWGKYGLYIDPGMDNAEFFECDWQPGMGTFVPAAALQPDDLYWDEKEFPQYHGDSDFTLRCKNRGFTIKTCLSLVIHNNIQTSGLGPINNIKTLLASLVSIRSNNNIRKRLIFYRRHGAPPFCYWGLFNTYFIYFGVFVKRKLLKL